MISSCEYYNGKLPVDGSVTDTVSMVEAGATTKQEQEKIPISLVTDGSSKTIQTGNTKPEELLAFAKTLIGVPYRYASTDPVNGFDCSGFITYVFNHFNISVPRSSIDFTHYKTEVNIDRARAGDLILFTGTDSTIREVGHMGIITSVNGDELEFIHSTSGKANGVTVTPLNKYYVGRFVKVIRVF
jgi:cell wall-associated NlpC family hydrolase